MEVNLKAVSEARGPFMADEWAYVTDKVGFLAVKGLHAPEKESWATVARPLLALEGKQEVKLTPIREFVRKQLKKGEPGIISCRVYGCPLDARALDRWLDAIPFETAKVSDSRTSTVQKENGECLVLEGDNWKLVVAGVMETRKDIPSFPSKSSAT